jgi:hypothetical protein
MSPAIWFFARTHRETVGRLYAPVQGNTRARKGECVGWGAEVGEGIVDFWDSIRNVNRENI